MCGLTTTTGGRHPRVGSERREMHNNRAGSHRVLCHRHRQGHVLQCGPRAVTTRSDGHKDIYSKSSTYLSHKLVKTPVPGVSRVLGPVTLAECRRKTTDGRSTVPRRASESDSCGEWVSRCPGMALCVRTIKLHGLLSCLTKTIRGDVSTASPFFVYLPFFLYIYNV